MRHWNRPPREVMDAPTLAALKAGLDGALGDVVWWEVSCPWLSYFLMYANVDFIIWTLLEDAVWCFVKIFVCMCGLMLFSFFLGGSL